MTTSRPEAGELDALRERLRRMPDDDIAYYEHQSGETAYLRLDAVLRELDAVAARRAAAPRPDVEGLREAVTDVLAAWDALLEGPLAKVGTFHQSTLIGLSDTLIRLRHFARKQG